MHPSLTGLLVWCLVALVTAEWPGLAATVPGRAMRARYVPNAGDGPLLRYSLTLSDPAGTNRWLQFEAKKKNGDSLHVWLQVDRGTAWTPGPSQIRRYLVQRGASPAREFRNPTSGAAVLPSAAPWLWLWPQADGRSEDGTMPPLHVSCLGHRYQLEGVDQQVEPAEPPAARVVGLRDDLWVGTASNTRPREWHRRYDGSDYPLQPLTPSEYREMAEAGLNCLKVDLAQLAFVEDLDVFYWGVPPSELSYPECLYESPYLGPALFLDEPAVHTRDSILRPRLASDETFRRELTPETAFNAFREYFDRAWREGASTAFCQSLKNRTDAALGEASFLQSNLFSWETMVSTAAYQLTRSPAVPSALVFEPPGRVGVARTLPELDMTYGCQIPTDVPQYFTDILYAFLRGAARLSGKQWGMSIYGAVDRTDAPGLLTRAYDLGATRFFFWDNFQLACVPYDECLGLARALKMRAENQPARDLEALRRAATAAILLPAGYNLGHVSLGKGNLWGLSELHLERRNRHGLTYRTVMANAFTEIERFLRLGVPFDVLGEFPGILPSGYPEVVRIREDGKVEVTKDGYPALLDGPRPPARPPGPAPTLEVQVSASEGPCPLSVVARATVTPALAPVYYTLGTDSTGVYRNAVVAWELYGPGEEDHRFLTPPGLKPRVIQQGATFLVEVDFTLDRPGPYRLRAATVDTAGRSTVTWIPLHAR